MHRTPSRIVQVSIRRRARRRGAAILECAIALPVMLLALFALLDLGIAATRYNALAEAARDVARRAILHGSLAPDEIGSWGPDPFEGTASDDSEIVEGIAGRLPTMPDEDVRVQVTWLDGANAPRDRVEVRIEYEHHPIVPGISAWGTIQLQSVATMRIVN